MKLEVFEATWIEEQPELGLDDLANLVGVPATLVQALADCGVIAPTRAAPAWRFAAVSITKVRRARQLREEFELDDNALALVLRLGDRIEELEREVRALRAGR